MIAASIVELEAVFALFVLSAAIDSTVYFGSSAMILVAALSIPRIINVRPYLTDAITFGFLGLFFMVLHATGYGPAWYALNIMFLGIVASLIGEAVR